MRSQPTGRPVYVLPLERWNINPSHSQISKDIEVSTLVDG
jgi:hypothetical protein